MPKSKKKITPKVNVYKVIDEAVTNGVAWGWRRAHKHTETPLAEYIQEQVAYYVMLSLEEVLKFDDEGPEGPKL